MSKENYRNEVISEFRAGVFNYFEAEKMLEFQDDYIGVQQLKIINAEITESREVI